MTPNLNNSPLAALIASATQTSQGADSPLNGAALPSGTDAVEGNFSNILQIHKGIPSPDIENLTWVAQPAAITLTPDSGQPLPPAPDLMGASQILTKFTYKEHSLTDESQNLSELDDIAPVNPIAGLALPVSPVTTEPAGGMGPPPGGKALPVPAQTGLSPNTSAMDQSAPDPLQSAAATRPPPPPVTLSPEPASPVNTLNQPPPSSELMSQLLQAAKPASSPGAPAVAPGVLQGLSEMVQSASEADAAGADQLRTNPLTAVAERPATAPVAPPAVPLPRMTGSAGWDQGLGQRILWMVDNGLNKAELRLDPPHLGSVNVRISVQDDQAQLLFQAAHPAARDALESALPRLREMFAQQGLELADTDISGQNEQPRDGGNGRPSDFTAEGSADSHGPSGRDSGAVAGTAAPTGGGAVSQSLVDEFV